jgi:hypothetical protein
MSEERRSKNYGVEVPVGEARPKHRTADDLPGTDRKVGVPMSSPALLLALVMSSIGAPLSEPLALALADNLLLQLEMQRPIKNREPEFQKLGKIPKDDFQRLAFHLERWALMCHALDTLHMSWYAAPDWCAQQLRKRGKVCRGGTVLRSYSKIEKWQDGLGRGRPRTYRPPKR